MLGIIMFKPDVKASSVSTKCLYPCQNRQLPGTTLQTSLLNCREHWQHKFNVVPISFEVVLSPHKVVLAPLLSNETTVSAVC